MKKLGEVLRDSCIFLTSELLKMNANNRATVIADSTHYQEAFLRLKETFDYAELRYHDLERYVFVEGQTPFLEILASPGYYWDKIKVDLRGQYSMKELSDELEKTDDSSDEEEDDATFFQHLSSKAKNTMLLIVCVLQVVVLVFFWLLPLLILWLLHRFTRLKRYVPKRKLSINSILVGTIVYFLVFGFSIYGDEYINLSARHVNTFLWLLIAISGSLLLRVKPELFRQGFLLYSDSHGFAGAGGRRSLGWYRSRAEGCHQQLHLRHPAHGRTPESRRLDRVRRCARQGDRHQLSVRTGRDHRRHGDVVPQLVALRQELQQPDAQPLLQADHRHRRRGIRHGNPAGARGAG